MVQVKVETVDWLTSKFSWSKCSTYAMCPRKAFYRYMLKLKEAKEVLVYGRAVHFGQELDNRAKLKGEKLKVAQILDAAVDRLKVEGAVDGLKVHSDRFALEHRTQLELYEKLGYRDLVRPVKGTVEAQYQIDLAISDPETRAPEAPAMIEGYVDVVSQADAGSPLEVIDYKSGPRPVFQKEAEKNLQFALQGVGAAAKTYSCVSFVRGGKQRPTTKRTEQIPLREEILGKLLQFLSDTVRSFRRSVVTGDWPKCAPTAHWCSKGACDYFDRCYPTRRVERARLIEVEEVRPAGSLPEPEWRNASRSSTTIRAPEPRPESQSVGADAGHGAGGGAVPGVGAEETGPGQAGDQGPDAGVAEELPGGAA